MGDAAAIEALLAQGLVDGVEIEAVFTASDREVVDDVGAVEIGVLQAQHEAVVATATGEVAGGVEDVIAGATVERVDVPSGHEGVIAVATDECRAGSRLDVVVASAGVDPVADATAHGVVTCIGKDDIGAVTPVDIVVASTGNQGIAAVATIEGVSTFRGADERDFVAEREGNAGGVGIEHDIADAGKDLVVAAASIEIVMAIATLDGVIASATLDQIAARDTARRGISQSDLVVAVATLDIVGLDIGDDEGVVARAADEIASTF